MKKIIIMTLCILFSISIIYSIPSRGGGGRSGGRSASFGSRRSPSRSFRSTGSGRSFSQRSSFRRPSNVSRLTNRSSFAARRPLRPTRSFGTRNINRDFSRRTSNLASTRWRGSNKWNRRGHRRGRWWNRYRYPYYAGFIGYPFAYGFSDYGYYSPYTPGFTDNTNITNYEILGINPSQYPYYGDIENRHEGIAPLEQPMTQFDEQPLPIYGQTFQEPLNRPDTNITIINTQQQYPQSDPRAIDNLVNALLYENLKGVHPNNL